MIKYSQVNLLKDNSGWVTSLEYEALKGIIKKLDIPVASNYLSIRQICYFPDKYTAIKRGVYYKLLGNKLAFDYYHGDPSISPEFQPIFNELKKRKNYFQRIRVSHSGIETLLLNEGFERQVFRIPIGLDIGLFSVQTSESKQDARKKLNIPMSAVVIGSFQKDGNGWGNGNEAKLIKGPDVFLNTLKILKSKIPELFVLLTGPSRGFVISGLEKLGIAYQHYFLDQYQDINQCYQALDAYLVTSREEGGPKAVLESMACGVPLISTKVGQAQDLVQYGVNGWLADIEDVEGLATGVLDALESQSDFEDIKQNGRKTAEQNSYESQLGLWNDFFALLLR